jgi:hypothetical protein
MIEDKIAVPNGITSFLIEGLLWNTPNHIFINAKTWNDILRNSIVHIYNQSKDENYPKNTKQQNDLLKNIKDILQRV